MNIPSFNEIIEPNDQTEARREHLEKLRELVGNVYPNKFERSKISGEEDTITNLIRFAPVAEIVNELKDNTPEGAKPDQELKAKLNERLKEFGNVRISGRLAVPPRVMGKAAFVHLSDGVNRLQIYVRRDDVKGIYNGSEPSAVADGLSLQTENSAEVSSADVQPPATAGGSDTVSGWELFKLLDHGDFVGASGFLFLTNTGELSVHVETLQFLSKALVPMPDKMHGISDPEIQRRYRYADLIASSLQVEHEGLTTREVFERRAKLISGMRRFLDDAGYIEVETPMLTPKATGAAATPFETHHNALDIPLYARIAPELYLKRLTVGGFEKVYELNRNFRNEGLSHKHNPEFTMLEFYCAYMDVNGMMDFAEKLLKTSVYEATGDLKVTSDGKEIDFGTFEILQNGEVQFGEREFERISMEGAIKDCWNKTYGLLLGVSKLEADLQNDVAILRRLYVFEELLVNRTSQVILLQNNPSRDTIFDIEKRIQDEESGKIWEFTRLFEDSIPSDDQFVSIGIESGRAKNYRDILADKVELINWSDDNGRLKLIELLFEKYAERQLIQPTFIIDYPKSISPLSKASPANPQIAERFELFINGMECANGFSELNDPQEQYERFVDQMNERESGDAEAMVLDEDYIRALAYGMPPAAGIGIGIDRLVMLLTNKHSIRDVILFPHMRPERKHEESETPPANPN